MIIPKGLSESLVFRRSIRIFVTLTALLYLGTAVYGLNVWWARRVASRALRSTSYTYDERSRLMSITQIVTPGSPMERIERGTCRRPEFLRDWRQAPPWGYFLRTYGWVPRRTYYEVLRLETGADLPNDPDAWEAWLKERPG